MPDWTSSKVELWMEEARKRQQYIGTMMIDSEYENFLPDEYKHLKLRIAYAMFGGPTKMVENDTEVDMDAYTTDQRNFVNTLFKSLKSNSSVVIKVAFIFIQFIRKTGSNNYEELQVPVIRFVSSKNKPAFLDQFCRVYSSWEDFLKWNELPEALCCYPRNGMYSIDHNNVVHVDFKESPRCFFGEKVIKVADSISIITIFVSLGLLVAGGISTLLFPPAATVLLAASAFTSAAAGAYSVGRNTVKLVDRGAHKQSVNPLKDDQARSCWLVAVGGALGVGTLVTSQHISALASEGEVASEILMATFNTLNVSSITFNGIGIVCQIYDLSQKVNFTIVDLANLFLSILFFVNSAVNMKTARTLIKETQTNFLDSQKDKLDSKAEAGFRAFIQQNKKELRSTIYGNAKTIQGIKKIQDFQQFFAGLQQARQDLNVNRRNKTPDGLRIRVNSDLRISVNDELEIPPANWKDIGVLSQSRAEMVNCMRKCNGNPDIDYVKDIKNICSKVRITFKRVGKNTMNILKEDLKLKDLSTGNKQI